MCKEIFKIDSTFGTKNCLEYGSRPVGRGGAMGAPAPPPQTAEVHFFVKKINSKKKIIVLFCLFCSNSLIA